MTNYLIDKTKLINLEYSLKREILRTNNLGSYSCTTLVECNTRKYHGLLICPLPEPDDCNHVLLSNVQESIIEYHSVFNLGMHKYAGDNYNPKGHKYLHDFSNSPVPKLVYRVGDVILTKEKVLAANENRIYIKYTVEQARKPTLIQIRPFLAFRNIHSLSKANMDVNYHHQRVDNGIATKIYANYPQFYLQLSKKNEFIATPDWYYNIEYPEEQARGYNYKEDLYIPGYFELQLKKGDTVVFTAGLEPVKSSGLLKKANAEINHQVPRDTFENCLHNTINQFFIKKDREHFVIAGYPWLPIRSRDALIALPGLMHALNKPEAALDFLQSISKQFQGHLIPEILSSCKGKTYAPDTPLWFIWTLQKYQSLFPSIDIWKLFGKQVLKIVSTYLVEKELFTINSTGLPYIEKPHPQNSWMQAEFEGKALIKRWGYLVELASLWYNALCFALENKNQIKNKTLVSTLEKLEPKVKKSFNQIFWNQDFGYLYDFVVDENSNQQVRPNQLIAAALPYSPLDEEQIKSIIDVVKNQLLTPIGIRSLSPVDPNYCPEYSGNHRERELAAYNGSVWPWLFAPYFDALVKVYPKSAQRAATRLLQNVVPEFQQHGLCSISEIYNGNPPHKAKGAIAFAMNTGELIRVRVMLAALTKRNTNP
ncbi:MAG: glycogen debranching enzyme N-terminal domain-containing protein [Salinivirgaceae bacterium]